MSIGRIIVLAAVLGFLRTTYGQQVEIKIADQKDTAAFLVKYFGKGTYYADTAVFKKGKIRFDMSGQKHGMFGLYIPNKPVLDFIYVGQSVNIETNLSEIINASKIRDSRDNEVYYDYLKQLNKLKSKAESSTREDAEKIRTSFLNYTDSLIQSNQDLFVSKLMKLFTEVKFPDSLTNLGDSEGSQMKRFNYYRGHYWDRVDLQDDRLVRTGAFHPLLENYFSKSLMVQHCDTIIKYAIELCDRLPKGSEIFQHCVTWITSNYGQSQIMGMDKVYVVMAERYYCNDQDQNNSFAYWMLEDEKQLTKLTDLCERVTIQKNLVIGAVPPNIILRDSTDEQWLDFYSLTNNYIILYFWDPECGHCKKTTPLLQELYAAKLEKNNVQVFAVGSAIGEDFEKWKSFIKNNDLEFINVAVTDQLFKQATQDARSLVPKYTTLESLNYQQTYDIFSTPKIWVLDKDKKIIAKGLSVEQLESFFDDIFTHQ